MLSNVHVIRFLCSESHTRDTVETEAGDLGVRDSLFSFLSLLHTKLFNSQKQVRHDLIGWLHKASPKGVTGLVRGWKRRYFVRILFPPIHNRPSLTNSKTGTSRKRSLLLRFKIEGIKGEHQLERCTTYRILFQLKRARTW